MKFFKLEFFINLKYYFKIKECIFNCEEMLKENYFLWELNKKIRLEISYEI